MDNMEDTLTYRDSVAIPVKTYSEDELNKAVEQAKRVAIARVVEQITRVVIDNGTFNLNRTMRICSTSL